MGRGWLIFLLGLALGTVEAAAQSFGDPSHPLLRIETGMHGGIINRLAVVGDEMVTVSDDKTMRRWSLADGKATGLWRTPIGGGDTGALYALAVSGTIAVVGGRTGDSGFSLFVFDLAADKLLGNIAGFSEPITSLAFAEGGTLLAVGLQRHGGVKVIDFKSHKVVAEDHDYGGTVNWLEFASDQRLASSSADGKVRLYAGDFAKPAAVAAMGAGDSPWGLAFSPDGRMLAVGSAVAARVRLFQTDHLSPSTVLAGSGAASGALSVVAWSRDNRLAAAGQYKDAAEHNLIRLWATPAGDGRDAPVAPDTVTDVAFLADGGTVYVTAQGSFGSIGADGLTHLARESDHCDFRDIWQDAFAVSKDGSIVEFPCRRGGKDKFRVDLTEVSLRINQPPRDDLKPPVTSASGITLENWRNSASPKLGGRAISLDPDEHVHSVAIVPGGSGVVFGTDYYLRLEHPVAEVWHRVLPAPAWSVDVTQNGRYAVAALGDGTIRWYNIADGSEVIDLFVDAHDHRWDVWVPEGFFDHSVGPTPEGGSALIGFQLNNGPAKQPDFVPAARLYAAFHRRELVLAKYWGGPHEAQRVADERSQLGDGRARLDAAAPAPEGAR